MWTGIIAGTAAYGVHRLRGALAMSGYEGLWGYFVLVLVGFLPADIWRLLGVVVGARLDEESELLVWVRAVATAVLAGVIAKIVFFPPGSLAAVPLAVRLAAIVCGFLAFLLVRRSVFAGLAAGETVLIAGGFCCLRDVALNGLALLHPELIHVDEGHRVLGLERVPAVEVGHRRVVRKARAIGLRGRPGEAEERQARCRRGSP